MISSLTSTSTALNTVYWFRNLVFALIADFKSDRLVRLVTLVYSSNKTSVFKASLIKATVVVYVSGQLFLKSLFLKSKRVVLF